MVVRETLAALGVTAALLAGSCPGAEEPAKEDIEDEAVAENEPTFYFDGRTVIEGDLVLSQRYGYLKWYR